MNRKPLPITLDGDSGHDDAIAWTLANASDELKILAVTSVGGNQPSTSSGFHLAMNTLVFGCDLPAAGRSRDFHLLERALVGCQKNEPSLRYFFQSEGSAYYDGSRA